MFVLDRRSLVAVGILAAYLFANPVAQTPEPRTPASLGTPSVLPQDGVPDILAATATQYGVVKLFSGAPGHDPVAIGSPFGATFGGGLRIAAGDLNADGVADGIIAMGPGTIAGPGGAPAGGLLRIYSGLDASVMGEGYPFGPSSTGGLFVAVGDVSGDGNNDLIASEGTGARLRAYSMVGGAALLGELMPYGPAFAGGVRIAAGDVSGDGIDDIITAPAFGAGTLKIYSGAGSLAGELFPFGPSFTGGMFVAAGDVNGDGRADIVASTSTGTGHIKVFSGLDGSLLHDIGPGLPSGISVATGDLDADGLADIVVGVGPGQPPMVGAIKGTDVSILFSFVPDLGELPTVPAGAPTGVVVATLARAGIRYTSTDHASFQIGQPGTFTVMTMASPTVSSITLVGTLPSGVTFTDNHDGTATLAATPGPGSSGDYTLTFTASNQLDPPAAQTFTLQVLEPCPVITVVSTPSTLPNGVINAAYAATFSLTSAAPAGTWSATNLPPGLTLNPGTGLLSGVPTMTGVFNGTVSYTSVAACQGSTSVSIAIAPSAPADTYTAGLGNTQIVAAGHSSPSTPHFSFAASVLANDAGPSLVVTPVTDAATSLGGQITIAVNGAFTYTPQAGDTGHDTYTYTVTSNGVSAQATITLAIGTQRVWYINSLAGAGDGRSNAPFNSLNSVNAADGAGDADAAGDYIYLHSGGHTGSFWSEPGQTLWGAGAAFTPVVGLAIPAGPVATIFGSVTIIGDNVTISSIAVSATTGGGIGGVGVNGLTIKNDVVVNASGGAGGVYFQDVNSTPGGAPNFGINLRSVNVQTTSLPAIHLLNVNQASGSFTITGDGGASNNGSGGVILSTQVGVWLQSARNVSLGYLTLTGYDTGSGIVVEEASGSLAVHHTTVSHFDVGLLVGNFNASLTSFSVSSSRFTDAVAGAYGSGIVVAFFGTAVVENLTIESSVIADNQRGGLLLSANQSAMVTATVRNNTVNGNREGGIGVGMAAASTAAAVIRVRIEHNTIGTSAVLDSGSVAGYGLRVEGAGDGRLVALVTDNQIHEVPNGHAIEVSRQAPTTVSAHPADVSVTNNLVTVPSGTDTSACPAPPGTPCPESSIFVVAASLSGGPAAVLNVDVAGNTAFDPSHEFPLQTGHAAYRLAESTGGTVQLVGSGDATTQITSTNTVSPASATGVNVDAGVTVIPGPIVTPP